MSKRILVLSFWITLLVFSYAFAIENIYPSPLSVVSTNLTFKWYGNGNVYYVYLGRTPQSLELIGQTNEKQFNLNLLPNSLYYWEIVQKKETCYEYGPVYSFMTLPSLPVLLNPIFTDNESTIVTLRWKGNGNFVVQLGLNPQQLNVVGTTQNNTIKITGLNPNSVYFWRILNYGKYAFNKSQLASFTTIPAFVNQTYPVNGATDIAIPLMLRWSGNAEQSYDLYLGTSTNNMKEIVHDWPLTNFSTSLEYSKTYYWYLKTTGYSTNVRLKTQVSSFKTQSRPYKLSGYVISSDGTPLQSVDMILKSQGDNFVVRTNKLGYWTKDGLTGMTSITPKMFEWSFNPEKIMTNGSTDTMYFFVGNDFGVYKTLSFGYTGKLNCRGWITKGDYYFEPFAIKNKSEVKIVVWATLNDLPPNDFYVFLLTKNEFENFINNNLTPSHTYDLTKFYNQKIKEFYLDFNENLESGEYFLVVLNNYLQFDRGAFGSATYEIEIKGLFQ